MLVQVFGLRPSSRARLMSNPHPYVFGVNNRGSFGFHQRDFSRARVSGRQSYGMPRNVPVRGSLLIAWFSILVARPARASRRRPRSTLPPPTRRRRARTRPPRHKRSKMAKHDTRTVSALEVRRLREGRVHAKRRFPARYLLTRGAAILEAPAPID